jgi:predicted phage terminase large subunit-like protein
MDELLRNALIRQDLSSFIAKTFSCVDPSTEYLHNWHIDLLADRLEKAACGKITRLIINIPPRSLKSVCISVAWPAWLLGNDPSAKIMAASYSQILSLKHSLDCRLVMTSPWYKEIFPDVAIAADQNEKFKFVTTARGFRFATSVGGTATGEGGDFLIVDDPHNPLQAASDVQRQNAIDWFGQTFMTRLNNKKKGVIVVVMQRLHVEDLTGHLLGKGKQWEHLCLPAIAPKRVTYSFYDQKKIRKAGEFLHKEREGKFEIERAKEDLGSYAFAAQYQQSPVLIEGGMVNLDWFCRYNDAPDLGRIVQSWDTAIKAGRGNDFSVCTTWKETDTGYYLLDVLSRKMEYPELKRAVLSLAEKFNPDSILIEDKASGQSLLQDLRKETKLAVLAIMPSKDKLSRFAAVTAMIEAGRVWLPNHASWLVDFESEIMGFPSLPHDDIVDSTSQFLNWVRERKQSKPRIRVL